MPQPLVDTNHPWPSEDTPLLFTCGYSFTLSHLWILFPLDTYGYSSTLGHLWILFYQWSPVDILSLLVTCGYFSTFDWTTLNTLAALVTRCLAVAHSYYALHHLGFKLPGAPNAPIFWWSGICDCLAVMAPHALRQPAAMPCSPSTRIAHSLCAHWHRFVYLSY